MKPARLPERSLTLSHRQTWEQLGISRATFYRRLGMGRYDHLLSQEPGRFSRAKVEQHASAIFHRTGLRAAS